MDDLWRNKGPDRIVDEHDIVGSRRNCRDCIGNGVLSMLLAFEEVYFPRQDIAIVLLKWCLKLATLIVKLINVTFRNLLTSDELLQCMIENYDTIQLSK